MYIVSNVRKLLDRYTPSQLLGHFANELEQRANHFETVGAPNRAQWTREEAAIIREAAEKLNKIGG